MEKILDIAKAAFEKTVPVVKKIFCTVTELAKKAIDALKNLIKK